MPVTSPLSPTRTLEAQKRDTVSMDRGVLILLSMGGDWSVGGSRCGRGCVSGDPARPWRFEFLERFPSRTPPKMSTSSPEAVKKLLENMQTDLRSLSMECKKKFPPVKEVSPLLAAPSPVAGALNHEGDLESQRFPVSHRGLVPSRVAGVEEVLLLEAPSGHVGPRRALKPTSCCGAAGAAGAAGAPWALSWGIKKL